MRFQDLESGDNSLSTASTKKKELPGSGEAQDFGQTLEIEKDTEVAAAEKIQKTQRTNSDETLFRMRLQDLEEDSRRRQSGA